MKNYFFFIWAILFITSPSFAQSWTQIGSDIDGQQEGDQFGFSVDTSADGTRIIVGARLHALETGFAGQAVVYYLIDNQWTQIGNAIDGTQPMIEFGYSVAISDDGNRIAVGAPKADPFGIDKGSVRVFEWINNQWLQLGESIDGSFVFDQAGQSVALSADGNRIAVGAHLNDGSGPNRGHVRVFDFINDNWVQMGANVDGENTSGQSGWSVRLSADGAVMAIGAISNNENGLISGQVRVYAFNGVGWVQMGSDLNGLTAGDRMGWSLDLSQDGTRLAIGAPQNIQSSDASGYVKLYEFIANDWSLLGASIIGQMPNEEFGSAVRLNAEGTKVAIGAPNNSFDGDEQGVVRIYELISGSWTEVASPIYGEAAGDLFGAALAFNAEGNSVAIGAIQNSGETNNAGHVRVFEAVVLGVAEYNSEASVQISPNPTTSELKIKGLPTTAVLTIADISGRVVLQTSIENMEVVPIQNLASGTYFLQLKNAFNGALITSEKIIIR